GCGECVMACPYSAMGYDAQGHHAVKCDLCVDRRAEGAQTTACASVCPTQAIRFGRREELLAEARAAGRAPRDQDHFLLGPATIYLERTTPQPVGAVAAVTPARAHPSTSRRPAFMDGVPAQTAVQAQSPAFPYRETRDDTAPDRVVPGGCNICFNCCTVKFHFKNNKLVKITGNDDDPLLKGRVCPKSQLTLQMYHSEHRLRYPQKRVGARGEGRFERISWDQALDEIAEKLKKIRDQYGAEALAMFVGTRTGILDYRTTTPMFAKLFGTPNKDGTDPFCASGKNVAFEITLGNIGSGNSYTENDLGSAQLYVYIGDNQAETRPVYFGMINDWRLKHGAKMVAVDPRLTATASKADRWLPIRPGTDMALALALSQHILANDLHDAKFCADWLLGFAEWRDFILQKNYTPEWAAPITGLAANDIRQLAEEIAAADGCVIFASRGINQHTNSTQTNRVLMFLSAITGNWGRRGGAYFNMSAGTPLAAKVPEHRAPKINKQRVR
ncbi:MAG: molybdopterin-dependent oxidoreductase, partial [Burkholderiales bacterium]|nr:molybdopterin-dependent oxidoreductase [Burkholderiales bacterium]